MDMQNQSSRTWDTEPLCEWLICHKFDLLMRLLLKPFAKLKIWVKTVTARRARHEANSSHPPSAEMKNGGAEPLFRHLSSWHSALLIKHMNKFTFSYPLLPPFCSFLLIAQMGLHSPLSVCIECLGQHIQTGLPAPLLEVSLWNHIQYQLSMNYLD